MELTDKIGNFLSGVFQWMFVGLMLFFAWQISPCAVPPLLVTMFVVWIALRKRD